MPLESKVGFAADIYALGSVEQYIRSRVRQTKIVVVGSYI